MDFGRSEVVMKFTQGPIATLLQFGGCPDLQGAPLLQIDSDGILTDIYLTNSKKKW